MTMLGVQFILMAAGLFLMLSKRVPLNRLYEIASPWTFFVGAVLFFHVPICFLACGAASEIETERAKQRGEHQLNMKKFVARWGWLDSSISTAAVVIAVGFAVCGTRRKPITEQPYESPVGVRDYVFESKLHELENTKAKARST